MNIKVLTHSLLVIAAFFYSSALFANNDIVGKWKVVDSRSGVIKSISEVIKEPDGTFSVKIDRFVDSLRKENPYCTKCPPPFQNKPLLGLKLVWGLKPGNKPNEYVDGYALDIDSGKIYRGKAKLSDDGRRLKLRGYVGTSVLGRTVVWIRADD